MTRLRVLTAEDWRAWRALRLEALAEAPYAFGSTLADWQGDGDREERWRARLSMPGGRDLLAEDGGRAVGMVSGAPAGDGTVELISLYVSATARGRGVGDLLTRAVCEWAAGDVRLAVRPGNAHALALYARHGFVPTDLPGDPLADGRRELVLVRRRTATGDGQTVASRSRA